MKPIQAANGFSFRVGFSGYSGHLRVEPLYTEERDNPIKSLPDFVLPPAFPTETPESIEEHIKEKYLLPRLDEDAFSPEKAGKQWDFDWFARAKIPLEPSMPRAIMVPVWELPFRRCKEGSTEGKWEPNSTQVDVSDIIIGGGLEDQSLERIFPYGASNGEWVREVLNGGPAQTIPPGFKQGLKLGDLMSHPCSWNVYKDQSAPDDTSVGNLSELSVQFDDLFKKAWEEDVVELDKDEGHSTESDSVKSEAEANQVDVLNTLDTGSSALDEILSVEAEKVDNGRDKGGQQQKEAWAVSGGSEWIADQFYELVPDMAIEFPFELDTFQKEAIYYLEKGESVFVAAHTSAGKTVVAEYAFALASKLPLH